MSLTEQTPRAGDNSADPFAATRADIEQRIAAFLQGADVWDQRAELDDDLAARANDFISGARKLWKEADDARKAEKQPHLNASRAVDESWASLLARVEKIVGIVKPRLEQFLLQKAEARRAAEAEARRKQREAEDAARAAEADAAAAQSASARILAEENAEVARKQAEQAARQAEASAAPARIQSATGLGRTRSLTTKRAPVITSKAMVLSHYRDHPEIEALLLKLLAAELRHAPVVRGEKKIPSIPGVEWREENKIS